MNRRFAVLIVIGLSCGLAACGSSKPKSAPAPVGPHTYTDAAEHFSVTTPGGWTEESVDAATLAKLENTLEQDPKLASLSPVLEGPYGSYVKIIVANPAGVEDAVVLVGPPLTGLPVNSLGASELENEANSGIEAEDAGIKTTLGPVTTINGHPAFSIKVAFTAKVDGQSLSDQTEYFFMSAKGTYSLDLVGTSAAESSQIAKSFQILG